MSKVFLGHPLTMSGILAVWVMLILGQPAMAHDFYLKPAVTKVRAGQPVHFSVMTSPNILISDKIETTALLKVRFHDGASSKEVFSLKENRALLTLDGMVTPKAPGVAILSGHRAGVIWNNTTDGWKKGSKKDYKGVIESGNYEKFCKTLITVDHSDNGFSRIVGHKLEIVPLTNPSEVRPGEELPIRVLLDGKPTAAKIYAVYVGFSSRDNTFSYFTEPEDDTAIPVVKISRPGLWVVKAEREMKVNSEDYDKHVLLAYLVFEVESARKARD